MRDAEQKDGMALAIAGVNKTFGSFHAVRDVNFEVEEGRIFGFLGTNGAGKTTTMRMILDIIRQDSGTITWNGTPVSELPRRRFGYLPEERGLYPKMQVEDQLVFLAQLSGAKKTTVLQELGDWLVKLDIQENRHRTVEQLSKGNQQKIQFLAAILHDPDILILDEPFSGLDPVNAEQMKQAFLTMRDRGKTVIFSTHQLDQAQELCQDLAIIHHGQIVASGDVDAVRRSTGKTHVKFAIQGDDTIPWLSEMAQVQVVRRREDFIELEVPDEKIARSVLSEAIRREAPVERFEISPPSVNDIFLSVVRKLPGHDERADALGYARPEQVAV
ncbi:MAG: ATP-binding cassette domain-containing protein [Thermomicrobiales bacterium]